jgi:hypothetical protein
LRAEPGFTSAGQSGSFFVGCHSRAILGSVIASEFSRDVWRPEHIGHPLPRVRDQTSVAHS